MSSEEALAAFRPLPGASGKRRAMTETSRSAACPAPPGVKATTIRFYEAEGLLPAGGRTEGGRRVFGPRPSRPAGLHPPRARAGLPDGGHPRATSLRGRGAGRALYGRRRQHQRRHLASVRERLARLRSLEAELARMTTCAHGTIADVHPSSWPMSHMATARTRRTGCARDSAIDAEPGRAIRRERVKAT